MSSPDNKTHSVSSRKSTEQASSAAGQGKETPQGRTWRDRLPLEPRILAGLGVLAGLLLLFGKIIEDVVNQESGAFDKAVLFALRDPADMAHPVGPAWLEGVVRDITALGGPTVITLITVISVIYLVLDGKRRTALLIAASIGGGAMVEKLLKFGFDRARPDIVPHLVTVHSLSFPSGHAMLSAITYLTLGTLLARAQAKRRLRVFILAAGLCMTLLIGLSRLYLGVHWPTDVLAGWCVGAAWVMVFWLIARRAAPMP